MDSIVHCDSKNMGGTGLKFESCNVKNHTQNVSQNHFLLLSELLGVMRWYIRGFIGARGWQLMKVLLPLDTTPVDMTG